MQKMLHTLNRITELLLGAGHEEKAEAAVYSSMEALGLSIGADRVQIWQNEVSGGVLSFVLRREWLSEVGMREPPFPVGLRFAYRDLPEWERIFSNGDCINTPFSALPQREQSFLDNFKIKSIAMIPLFLEAQFWGFLSLQDCKQERTFLSDQISVLRSAGLLIVNALLRGSVQVDITAKEAHERFEAVWSHVECGIMLIDAQTHEIIDVNPIAVQMFGGNKANVIGRRCHEFLCPDPVEGGCPVDLGQPIHRSDRAFVKANGEMIPVIKSITKIMLNGRLTLLESFTDVTNLREAEDKLHQMSIAEQANQAKSDFLSTMSHEMRTPMNAIIGMTAIGKSSENAERKHYALGKIEDASTHLLGIINDVLDMSKIEAGKFELSFVEFSFEAMLQRVVSVLSFRVDEKQQVFTLEIDKNIPPVLIGDDQRLAQIITNLLGNAIKFTPVGGAVTLRARLVGEGDNGCTIQIEVIDSGIGISLEQQSRLFQSFQQADSNTARKFGGTGLGLSITKNIVEMMDGKIWVESELDQGAKFAFTVELKRGDTESYERSIRKNSWKNVRILAVDDNVGILGYVKSFVEGHGVICDTAASGREALELTREKGAYDIYFLDWKMSDTDGMSLTRELKAMDLDRDISVVIMIASVDWGDMEKEAKQAGVDRFLPKPLFPSAIADIINDFLGVIQDQIDQSIAEHPLTFKGRRILLAEDVEINREIVLSLLEPTLVQIDCAENGVEALRLFEQSPER